MGLVIEELDPAPALRGVVERVADFHERSAPRRRLESPLVGLVLIVSLGPDMEIDGRPTGSFVAGVWDRPTVTAHYGEQAGYQLYLDVLGARRLLGVPASELANQLVALEDVVGGVAGELAERLADASSAQERHAAAQQLLVGVLGRDDAPAREVAYVLERLLRVEHAARRVRAGEGLAEIAYEAGYSDQAHFNRDFRDLVGCTPSQFPFVQDLPMAA